MGDFDEALALFALCWAGLATFPSVSGLAHLWKCVVKFGRRQLAERRAAACHNGKP